MAHQISITKSGIQEAMFAMNPAWHGLGTVLDHAPTSLEAIEQAHLANWNVHLQELRTESGLLVPNHYATVRGDEKRILGVVSDRYKIVQNEEAFEWMDSLLQDGLMRYDSAGALKGGKTVWILARMPSVDTIAAGDNTLRYILFSTSHDGTGAIHALPTSVRVVCANTLKVATTGSIGIRHTGNLKEKLEAARLLISQFDEKFTLFRDHARKLAEKKLQGTQAKDYINELFPEVPNPGKAQTARNNKVDVIRQNYKNPRQQMASIKDSWWALYNAVSESIDHPVSKKGQSVSLDRRESRMMSTLDGIGAQFKEKAFELALQMAG